MQSCGVFNVEGTPRETLEDSDHIAVGAVSRQDTLDFNLLSFQPAITHTNRVHIATKATALSSGRPDYHRSYEGQDLKQ
jgi:hypothetical protein